MTNDSDKLTSLLAYVQAERRVCPQPQQWDALGKCCQAKIGMVAVGNLRYRLFSLLGGIPVPWRTDGFRAH